MNPSSWMDSLRKVELSELDLNNIGSWPNAVKVIAGVLLMALILGLGYNFHISDLEAQLQQGS